MPHPERREHAQHRHRVRRPVVVGQDARQTLLFARREPARRRDPIRQRGEYHRREHDRRKGFQDEHPLPAGETEELIEFRDDQSGQ